MKLEVEKFYEFSYDELNLSDEDVNKLYEIGLQTIKQDKRKVVEYVVNQIFLESIIEKPLLLENKKLDILKEKIKIIVEK